MIAELTDHRTREVLAGSWILAHADGRKLSHHTDEGVWWQFEDIPGALYQRPRKLRRWPEVLADMQQFNAGGKLPAA